MAVPVGLVVGVGVAVAVTVTVGVTVGSTTRPVPWRTKYTTAAPMAKTSRRRPSATGRLMVTSGILGPLIAFAGDLAVGAGTKLRPHTRQRVAFSVRRVPQVGQIFVAEVFSGLIGFRNRGAAPGRWDYTISLGGSRSG